MPHSTHFSIQNTTQIKQLFVKVELRLFDVTACSLVGSCWGCGGTRGLNLEFKIDGYSNQSTQNTVSHNNWRAELTATC